MGQRKRQKQTIAIIGGGISGMGAAYSLAGKADITLFESRARLGGHARTIIAGRNNNMPVDTGFMVFNYKNYPRINKLFKQLNIPVKKTDMSFAVSLDSAKKIGAFEYSSNVLANKGNLLKPSFWRIITDLVKFNAKALTYMDNTKGEGKTLEDCAIELGLSDIFIERYLCPMAGAIWSTSLKDIRAFPAESLIRFFDNHGLLSAPEDQPQWYTVDGGSIIYVKALQSRLIEQDVDIQLNSAVSKVERKSDHVLVDGQPFDQVIFACHSDQALKLLTDPSGEETDILGAIKYRKNTVVLHNDASYMPKRKACWAAWVYKGALNPGAADQATFSYWMNLLQSLPENDPCFVTLNPQPPIQAEHIYDETTLSHPQFDLAAIKAQEKLPAIQGQNRSWFCGAWTRYGFHEDGLDSGMSVAETLTETLTETLGLS